MSAENPTNPLLDLHRQAEAEFQQYGEIEIVSTFGEPQAEYGALHKSCGMLDLPQRAFIELTGKDRLTFLNNLLTNQTWDKQTKTGLQTGATVYAYLLNAKTGRVIADVNVIELGERTLLELDRRIIATVLPALERYRFSEDVALVDRSADLHEIGLYGPLAREIAAQLPSETITWPDQPTGSEGVNVITPIDDARRIWMNLLTQFAQSELAGKRSLRAVGWAAYNATRIEAGRAIFGIDFDETFVPAETGPLQMKRAVSFTKGCYPGQEIVARMHARQQVAKQLVGFKMTRSALPIAGAQIFDETQADVVGAVTSSTLSPVLSSAAIGFALVKKTHLAPQSKLKIGAEGAMHDAVVVALPFIHGDVPR